jgi:hypothetical protein
MVSLFEQSSWIHKQTFKFNIEGWISTKEPPATFTLPTNFRHQVGESNVLLMYHSATVFKVPIYHKLRISALGDKDNWPQSTYLQTM